MTITPEQLTALLIIIIPIVGTQIVNIISTFRIRDEVSHVKAMVNGTASEQRAELKAVREQVTQLLADRADQKQVAAVLAQATTPLVVVAPSATPDRRDTQP